MLGNAVCEGFEALRGFDDVRCEILTPLTIVAALLLMMYFFVTDMYHVLRQSKLPAPYITFFGLAILISLLHELSH